MKNIYSYVEGIRFIPLWETDIVFNKQDGYYEKILIGIADDDTPYLVPIILSLGNGCGDNRALREDDDTVTDYVYQEIISYLRGILNTDWIGSHFANLIGDLMDWLEDELEKKAKEER